MLVVDASVVIKWFIPEPDSESAKNLVKQYAGFIAPEHLAFELAAAVNRAYRQNRITAPLATILPNKITAALTRSFSLVAMNAIFEDAYALSLDIKHALADCLYLKVAMDKNCDLVTADVNFLKRAHMVYPRVYALQDITKN